MRRSWINCSRSVLRAVNMYQWNSGKKIMELELVLLCNGGYGVGFGVHC